MNEKEKRIKEQRVIEATRKGLTGMEGKFGCILRYLGQPIVSHTSGWFSSNEMEDVWALSDDQEEAIQTMDEDQPITEVGLMYDGMSSGLHLEIKYLHDERRMTVYYQGVLIFCEINDELECYVPSHEWEDKVDYLFNIAKSREEKKRQVHIAENKQETQRQKLSFLERLRLRWGL